MSLLSPREKRAARTRKTIIEAAQKLIIEQGIENLSMRALAEAIDYTPGAIYKYFDSKANLLNAIREDGLERMAELLARRDPEHLSPPQRLIADAQTFLEFAETYPEHYMLMFNNTEGAPRSRTELEGNVPFAGLLQFIRVGVEEGVLVLPAGYTAETLGYHVWFLIHGMVMLKITFLKELSAEFDQIAEDIIQAYVKSISRDDSQ